jgi:glycosyltransferase involved in cell wall biosynthesis
VLPLLDPRLATVMIAHSDSLTFYEPLRHYSRFITRAVGVSEEICKHFVDYCGVPTDRVTWIPYGVESLANPSDSESSDGPIRLAFVGRVTDAQKRASDLIPIVRGLTEQRIDFRLDVVGDGDVLPKIRQELATEILGGYVTLHGWLESAEVLKVMRQSDAFLLPSDSEGFCIALTEAMANGCCPIVTDIRSGNKKLVNDGASGFIVPVGGTGEFVDRIKLLAENRELLGRMRKAAWQTGREYGVDRMVESYVSCFERAVDDGRTNPRTPDPSFPLMPSCRSKYPLWLRRIKAKMLG